MAKTSMAKAGMAKADAAKAELTISSRNYGAWALRGWLMARFAGLDFTEKVDFARRSGHEGRDAAAVFVDAGALAAARHASRSGTRWPSANTSTKSSPGRDCCRPTRPPVHIAARSAARCIRASPRCAPPLPMNIKAHFPDFKIWSRAQADIDRVIEIWQECLERYGGPYLFGKQPCVADAMYAPVVTRLLTYDVRARRGLRRLLPADHGAAAPCRNGSRPRSRSPTRSTSSMQSSDGATMERLRYAQGFGSGTSHTGSTSIDLKSAGDTISRYSMSGE